MPTPAPKTRSRPRPSSYLHRSQQPLQSLIFLLPLIITYEIGTFLMHNAAATDGRPALTIRAYSLLNHFFELLGVTGYYLPGIIVIVVLFCWHLASKPTREDWRFSPKLYLLMGLECALLAIPLLVWGLVFFRETASLTAPQRSLQAIQLVQQEDPTPHAMPEEHTTISPDGSVTTTAASPADSSSRRAKLGQQIILSIGAGIYEELLFRLIAIALLHTILVDLLALPHAWGAAASVAISAIAFGLYHFANLNLAQWSAFDWLRCIFYILAGVFLAIIYVLRGFGIVAGTHALYDILMAVLQFLTSR